MVPHLNDEEITNHTLQALAMRAMGVVLVILGFLATYMFNQLFGDIDMLHERVHQLEIRVEVLENESNTGSG